MSYLRNLSHAVLIGSCSYAIIMLMNSSGIRLFSGMLDEFGLIMWLCLVFVDLSLMRV